jgi:signal recognition particle subunit SRP54
MGDMLTLIEKAEEVFEKEEAEAAATALMEGTFTFEDFLDQMQQVKKMGPLGGLVKLLPGVPKEMRDVEIDDRELARVEGMIKSMTIAERRNPDLIDASRRTRIANGSGMQAADVGQLVAQFKEMQRLMKRMGGFGSKKVKKSRNNKKGKGKGGGRTTAKGPRMPKLPDLQKELEGLPDLRPRRDDLGPAGPGLQ